MARATLNAKSDRRTAETVAKCKFFGSSRNPFVTSCSSDIQNCGEMQMFELDGQPFRHFVWSDVRNCGKTMIFLCRGRLPTPCAHFIQFCARRCSETYILKFWMIARNCGETQILSSWNRSAHWPGRVNVCVLYLQDGSAHCICYHNLLNMVVPENLPRG